MYLDESGDHNLTVIDPQYPVFVLGGIVVDQEYAEGALATLIQQFKIIEAKFRRRGGDYRGAGLVVLPTEPRPPLP